MRWLSIIGVILIACTPPWSRPGEAACALSPSDAAWLKRALSAWDVTRKQILHLDADREQPVLVLFDAACAYRRDAQGHWGEAAHHGRIDLPNGRRVAPGIVAFAATYDQDRRAFLVMALPSVWRAARVNSPLGLETLLSAVLVHEMTHTHQLVHFGPRLSRIVTVLRLGPSVDDDVVQTRFGRVPAFAASVRTERDLLFAAATVTNRDSALALTRRATARIDARRARFFARDSLYTHLEDSFLMLEGVAQLASYRWLTHDAGAACADDSVTMTAFRRGGRRWSQDQGLALFLVISRLVPDWRVRVFSDRPASTIELLRLAADSA